MKALFTIQQGGERIYIHPISVDSYFPFEDNKMQFLLTPEFQLDQKRASNDWVGFNGLWYSLSLRYRPTWDMARYFFKIIQLRLSNIRWIRFKDLFRCLTPVFCSEIYNETISVHGNLLPSRSGQQWTDTIYLVPSHNYLMHQLTKWLNSAATDKYDLDKKNRYLKWASEQHKLNRKIILLSSLDT